MNVHERAGELLTWQVIGRLSGEDLAWLGDHLETCAHCRAEQRVQRRIRDAVASQPVVEFAPQASFNRLWQQIEADSGIVNPHAPTTTSTPGRASRRAIQGGTGTRLWLKGLVAAQAAAIVLLGTALWHGQQERSEPAYRTVTDDPGIPLGANEIKAIFADQVRITDVKEILAGSHMRIAAGPNGSGVYTLVSAEPSSAPSARAALARLRADPRVRFAVATPTLQDATRAH